MRIFDPFLMVKIDYVQDEVMEVVIESEYDDVGQAECSIETVLCLFANLIKAHDEEYSFDMRDDRDYCEALQRELRMYWMDYDYIITTIATMLKLGYLDEDDGYYSLNESCPLVNTRYNVYNRLEKQF